MHASPTCQCFLCLESRGELTNEQRFAAAASTRTFASTPARATQSTAVAVSVVVTPPDNLGTAPNNVTARPKRSADNITMAMVLSTKQPKGPYCNGYGGPTTVLAPRLYGDATSSDKKFLDVLREASGHFILTKDIGDAPPSATDLATTQEDDLEEAWALDMTSMGLQTGEAFHGASRFHSPVVNQCLLQPMQKMSVFNVDNYSHAVQVDITSPEGKSMSSNSKSCFFFSPLMIRNNTLSSVNNENVREYVRNPQTGEMEYNKSFWPANLVVKNLRNGGTFTTLDVGMFIPQFVIPEEQLNAHREAVNFMELHGPCVHGSAGNGVALLSLKQAYAHVFVSTMQSELVVQARKAGYHPLWLIKNCLCQTSARFGINGYQFSTLDKRPKSYLSLVAFYKGGTNGEPLIMVTLTNNSNEFLKLKAN